jgi:two-component system, NarL family, invasion response regulator UvrY
VLLVDDHCKVRGALNRLLQQMQGIEVVGSAGGGAEALLHVSRSRPDVVLMDLSMPDVDGVTAMRAILAAFPAVRVLAFTAYSDPDHVVNALDAGATGYLLKGGDVDELVGAVKAAARGERWLSPQVALVLRVIRPDAER